MDASQVLTALNSTWTSLLDNYYDHIADEYLSWMSSEYNIPIDVLKEKSLPVKEKVISDASLKFNNKESSIKKKKQSVSSIKMEAKKAEVQKSIEQDPSNIYLHMTRKELVDTCREKGLPIKRKNQDMVDALKSSDQNIAEDASIRAALDNRDFLSQVVHTNNDSVLEKEDDDSDIENDVSLDFSNLSIDDKSKP